MFELILLFSEQKRQNSLRDNYWRVQYNFKIIN